MDSNALQAFEEKFCNEISELGLKGRRIKPGQKMDDLEEQILQREHFDWFADALEGDYNDYATMPFWRAVDEITFDSWAEEIRTRSWRLDIGAANGRSAFPLDAEDAIVIGFDISKKMIRQAIDRAEAEGKADRMMFFVADGSYLPFKSGSFDLVQTYGVLHHLPDPGGVVLDIQRILKADGIHLGSENNESAFRKLFDLLMKISPLWIEEAGEEPLLSRQMMDKWYDGTGTVLTTETRVFLPPHLYNAFGRRGAKILLGLSDKLCGMLPWMKNQGGLIVFTAKP